MYIGMGAGKIRRKNMKIGKMKDKMMRVEKN